MNVGIHIVSFTLPGGPAAIGPTLTEVARAAEEAGATNLSLMDHYLQLGGWACSADEPMLEGYTTLGYLAAITSTVELQLLVTGLTYRHPGLLAKIVSTLDVLSGGRPCSASAPRGYEEHRALGVPFSPLAERFERLEETVQIVQQMWSDDVGPYAGKHHQLGATINSPQPLRRPHPPIMIGGGWGDDDPPAGRQVRRRKQPLRRTQSRAGRGGGQVGRAAQALRQGGHRLRPDPQDHPVRSTARTR
jgi:alkanesulfonate monooxygenase SsuD/methylene tetrahydromethanopterin reductase-like flavin-dependent oxidoreductase (luciferase family)